MRSVAQKGKRTKMKFVIIVDEKKYEITPASSECCETDLSDNCDYCIYELTTRIPRCVLFDKELCEGDDSNPDGDRYAIRLPCCIEAEIPTSN